MAPYHSCRDDQAAILTHQARVIKNHGYFKVGEVLDVLDVIPYAYRPDETQYLVIAGGNTIPRENIEWHTASK